MAKAEQADPEKFAEVTQRYPVLTKHQLRHRTRRELSISQMNDGARGFFSDLLYSSDGSSDFRKTKG